MATITSAATGLWSATGTWVGGVVPVDGDKVIIASGHVVTVDGTRACGNNSVTTTIPNAALNISGTLKADRAANSTLTVRGLILCNVGTNAIDYGLESDPLPSGILATLILNRATTPAIREGLRQVTPTSGAGNYVLWSFWSGDTRVRGVKLASTATAGTGEAGTPITLDSAAHNWRIGDELMFMKTTATTATDDTETRTITAIAGASITLNSNLTYTHLVGLPIGNLTCDITVKSFNEVAGQQGYIAPGGPGFILDIATLGYYWKFKGVAFVNLAAAAGNNGAFGTGDFGAAVPTSNYGVTFRSCTYKLTLAGYSGSFLQSTTSKPAEITDFVLLTLGSMFNTTNHSVVTRLYAACVTVVGGSNTGNTFNDCYFGMRNGNSSTVSATTQGTFNGCYFFGVDQNIIGVGANNAGGVTFNNCDLGFTFPWGAKAGGDDRLYRLGSFNYGTTVATFNNCLFGENLSTPTVSVETFDSRYSQLSPITATAFYNKGGLATAQEIYYASHVARRDNSVVLRGTSSTTIKPIALGVNCSRTQNILCPDGASIRIVGYVQANAGYYNGGGAGWNPPTVTLSGLGATPVVFTASAAANGAWERYVLTITNSSGAAGNFVLTFTANAKTSSTGQVYFDGVTDSPFITKARHFGFTYDEAIPTRTVNTTVTLTNYTPTAASLGTDEATAIGIGGVTVTGGPSVSPLALTASRTFQQVYDYTQAWGAANLANALPLTGVGLAGAPALFAAGNVTTTGYTLNGAGSLGLGSYVLTASLPWSYTYTGGTFSQASTVPAFSGGQLDIGAAGTFTFTMAASMIVSMTPSAPGTYNMASTSFTGTVDLRNTTAHAITVQLPAGTTYTTASNVGGAITVTLPVTYQSVTVNGLVVGSRVQIYDLTSNTELANAVAVASTYTWTDSVAASASRAIRLRVAYVSGATAKQFIEANIGTCGTSTGDAGISYLASQTDDLIYIANAVDGSTVTECSIVGTNLFVSVNAGSITISRIYAFMVYWLSTVGGIEDQSTEMIAKDTANYIVNTGFQIRNATTGPTIPLLITGGNIDPATGVATDILDTSGGSIFVNSSIVVPYSSGAEATIAIVQAGLSAQGFTTPVATRIDAAISSRATAGDIFAAT